jgi:secreted PhoX family phosphatase
MDGRNRSSDIQQVLNNNFRKDSLCNQHDYFETFFVARHEDRTILWLNMKQINLYFGAP